ncbi:glycosyl transferase family 2 [Pseudalgibacter alginicilyticus]|uniref:Glycosyl transferase family 2 n=1 Tax=Pseudalgibacter alginicilyticus TaxID=1736674 RepID=A0A0P0CP08_9FLAO|nr:glycosyltransferase family 2 protein [Pseudalgibacter alginicilyticus]ALJ04580.1 glycosyl transferase family 2 [Pseudalgibacter alginicilyticus]
MNFTLIVCTYMRPKPLLNLLQSVSEQTLYPNEILIIDGSTNQETESVLIENQFRNLKYHKVDETNRGLTKQRNLGIDLVNINSEFVCFLDDDVVLKPVYFEAVLDAFNTDKNVVGVGGIALNENRWVLKGNCMNYNKNNYYEFDGYIVEESLRNKIRNICGLQSPCKPGIMPDFSHGRTYNYPLTGKNYEVDLLIGMSFSFKRVVFENIVFSNYFEGYGLYEDADYSLRALKFGKNVISTRATLYHFHHPSGRPNPYKYGKMVLRNGWYVWRVKYPNPNFKAHFKWHTTAMLLTMIRLLNVITTSNKKEALIEGLGRIVGWFSLIFNAPKIEE